MKAILIFTLPEDNQEFELALKGSKMYSTLWDFDQWLRSEIKYKEKELEEVRDKLQEFMNNNHIDFDMVE
jgi:hypothetical protein